MPNSCTMCSMRTRSCPSAWFGSLPPTMTKCRFGVVSSPFVSPSQHLANALTKVSMPLRGSNRPTYNTIVSSGRNPRWSLADGFDITWNVSKSVPQGITSIHPCSETNDRNCSCSWGLVATTQSACSKIWCSTLKRVSAIAGCWATVRYFTAPKEW